MDARNAATGRAWRPLKALADARSAGAPSTSPPEPGMKSVPADASISNWREHNCHFGYADSVHDAFVSEQPRDNERGTTPERAQRLCCTRDAPLCGRGRSRRGVGVARSRATPQASPCVSRSAWRTRRRAVTPLVAPVRCAGAALGDEVGAHGPRTSTSGSVSGAREPRRMKPVPPK
jgi:hypothetical protein